MMNPDCPERTILSWTFLPTSTDGRSERLATSLSVCQVRHAAYVLGFDVGRAVRHRPSFHEKSGRLFQTIPTHMLAGVVMR